MVYRFQSSIRRDLTKLYDLNSFFTVAIKTPRVLTVPLDIKD